LSYTSPIIPDADFKELEKFYNNDPAIPTLTKIRKAGSGSMSGVNPMHEV
jgi:hypothetical protein